MNRPHDDRDDAERLNPYASPRIPNEPPPEEDELCGVFRSGNEMVVHRYAKLPRICVKTNRPADAWMKLNFTTIASFMLSKPNIPATEYTIAIGVSRTFLLFYRIHQVIFVLIALLGIVIVTLGWDAFPPQPRRYVSLTGICVFTTAPIYAYFFCQFIETKKVTPTHVWLKGVHPDYLARLPEWPGG